MQQQRPTVEKKKKKKREEEEEADRPHDFHIAVVLLQPARSLAVCLISGLDMRQVHPAQITHRLHARNGDLLWVCPHGM